MARQQGTGGATNRMRLYGNGGTNDSAWNWTGTAGKFRFTWDGSSTLKAYVWTGAQWEWNGNTAGYTCSEDYSGDEMAVNLLFEQEATGGDVEATFDNFQINSGHVIYDVNRKKVAFTTADGTTQCYAEIEDFDVADEEVFYWVKVPIISSIPFTVEVFIQKDTQGSGVSLVAYQPKGANAEGRGWLLRCNSDIPGFLKGSGDGSWESVNATTDIANSEYHHLAVRFEADTLFDILINGTIEDNETNPSELTDVTYADSGSSSNPPTKQARIFCGVDEPGADSGFADGKIDEIRISNTVRSVSWVKATNYTARDNFITYTAPETEPAPSVGTFNGYVQLAGENVARIVTLYRRSTGELQDYTTSNPNTGYFELETPYDELHYLVILPDIDDGYQPIARDQIDPV